jgi:stage II sporulation protein D
VRDDGQATGWIDSPIVIRATDADAFPVWNERRYRGELALSATDSGITVVNRLPLESYLRGVVALEMGDRPASDMAALEAQAVAARSYTVARLRATGQRDWDLGVTVSDQVYGGVDAERTLADAAVAATDGEVLTYGGRVVSAPYHSTCGGSTAEATEVWRGAQEPFLTRVSDRIPGTDRAYCDIAPRFRWERTFERAELDRLLERYLRRYSSAPDGSLGATRHVSIDGTTPSGRAAAVVFTTSRGSYRVRGNDARYILRSPGGELLNSTYFSLDETSGRDGSLTRIVLRGRGYGHGVGMCQWGAIGRARAGQSYRQILSTYYPGTTVERAE